jgi:hypothetical protein
MMVMLNIVNIFQKSELKTAMEENESLKIQIEGKKTNLLVTSKTYFHRT